MAPGRCRHGANPSRDSPAAPADRPSRGPWRPGRARAPEGRRRGVVHAAATHPAAAVGHRRRSRAAATARPRARFRPWLHSWPGPPCARWARRRAAWHRRAGGRHRPTGSGSGADAAGPAGCRAAGWRPRRPAPRRAARVRRPGRASGPRAGPRPARRASARSRPRPCRRTTAPSWPGRLGQALQRRAHAGTAHGIAVAAELQRLGRARRPPCPRPATPCPPACRAPRRPARRCRSPPAPDPPARVAARLAPWPAPRPR